MKKKSPSRSSAAKKSITRTSSKKKKSFSLKSWLLGGLVLLVASAYGLYQYNLQPKGLKVLELSGDIFDYIIPEPTTINEICGGSCGLDATGKVVKAIKPQPMAVSSSDTLRDINATIEIEAKKVVKQEKATDNSTEEERVQRVVQEMTTNLQNNTSGITFKDVKKEYEADGKVKVTKESIENAAKLQEVAKDSVKVLLKPQTPPSSATQNPGTVNSGSTCPTAAGWGVYSGSSMIGAGDEVYECKSNGTWSGTDCIYKAGNPNKCTVSVLPIYAQESGKANCYTEGGSIVVGNGSVVEGGNGSGRQCRGTKDLVDVTWVDGRWMSQQEIKEKKDQEAAKVALEKRTKDESECKAKKGTYNVERGEGSCTPNVAYEKCISSGTGYKWDEATGKCNTINPIVAPPTTVSDTIRSNAAATSLIKNPTGKLTGGEVTNNSSDCRYGSEEVAQSNEGIAYKCKDYTGKVPTTLTPTNFGAASPTSPVIPTSITDNSSEKVLKIGEKCSESYGLYNNVLGNTINNSACKNQCAGGIYTVVSYGTFGWNKVSICGPSNSDVVASTVNVFKLSETNVKIIGDNKADFTTKKLSKCSNDFGSDNLCSRCEVGVVTDVETSNGTIRFCGSKEEVSNLISSNPGLISSPTAPNNTGTSSDPELEDNILNRNGRVNAIVQGPHQCKYEGGEYIGWFKYRCPGEDGTLSSNDQPYCSSEVSDQCDGQSNTKCSPTKDGGKCVDMNGVDIVLDVVSPEGAADTVVDASTNTWNGLGSFFGTAWSQIVGTFTNIGNDTVEVVDYAATLDDPADLPVRPTKPAANPGTVKLKGECFVHSDCEPGLHCKTTWGNLQTSTCAKSSTEIVEKRVVGQGGKLSVGTPCYDDDQCESGAVCNKSVFADTCKPKDVPAGGSVVEDKDQKYKNLPTGSGVYSYTKDGIVYIILPDGYTEQNLKDLNNSATEKE